MNNIYAARTKIADFTVCIRVGNCLKTERPIRHSRCEELRSLVMNATSNCSAGKIDEAKCRCKQTMMMTARFRRILSQADEMLLDSVVGDDGVVEHDVEHEVTTALSSTMSNTR